MTSSNISPEPRWSVRRATARALAVLGALAAAVVALIAVRAYHAQVRGMFTATRHVVSPAAARRSIATLTDVRFEAGGNDIRGWFAPSENGAAVVLSHGALADRNQVLPEAEALHEAGFGVLLFDWPGHGESSGEPHWSAGELAALRAAVGFLAQHPTVRAGAIGALGFSMGGYMTAIGAATDTRIRAVALCAAPADLDVQTDWDFHVRGWPSQLGARWANRRYGPPATDPTPRSSLPRLAPRPVLVVGGALDDTVPSWMVSELYAMAGEPRRLVFVPSATHSSFAGGGRTYVESVREFFAGALLNP